jgi:autotransporter-associated beta strand protein
MTSPSPLGRAALAVVAVFALTHVASAQTTATWIGGNTTNDYNFGTNWSTGSAPNAIDSQAVFTSAASTSWTNATNSLGSLLVSGGTLVIGNNGISTDVLRLATSSGGPVISNTTQVFLYANVEGTQGFTKTGAGDLAFRFQTNNMSYTGNITMNAGTLTVNQDGSLGFSNNKILAASNSTLNINPGANTGNVTFASSREIAVSNGVTFNIQMGNTNITSTFSNPITGAGRVDFIANSAGATNQATSFRYTLAGANTYVGRTTIQMGAKLTLTNGSTLSTTNELSISGGSGTWAALDLGGSTANVATFAPASASTTARQIIISNGILNATNPSGAFSFNGFNGTLLDMSNLTTFSFGNTTGGTARNFSISPDTALTANTNTVFFARGSNSITALTNRVGGAAGASQGPGHLARLFIGTNNAFNSAYMEAGGFNGEGTIDFMADVTNGAVKLRGTNGTDAMGTLVAGNTSAGTRSGAGRINLGIVDALVTNTIIGNFNANNITNLPTTNSITMAGGAFTSTNLLMGAITNTNIISNTVTINSTFQQNGGTSTITTIRMGDDRNTNATTNAINYVSSYNLSSSNAVLRAATIDAGTNAFFGTGSARKINFGAGRIETLDASTDLTISGFNTTAAGRLEIAVASNAQTKTFFADTNRKITLEQSAILTFDGGITKGGAGTLVLKGANVHNGNTTVAAGTLELQSTGSLRFQIGGSGTNNQLNGPGTASLNGQFVFNLASASTDTNSTWTIVSNSLTTTYGTNFLPTPGFSGSGGNWTNTTNGVNYVFAQSNGVLSVQATSGVTPYNAWVAYWQTNSAGFTNTAGTDNPDGDPFDNNEEFAFDGNPTIGTGALLTAVKVGTNAVFNYVALTNTNAVTYQVQITGNLTNGWTNASVTISNSLNQSNISQTNSYLRKEFTVPGTGNEFYRVQATIAP